MSAPHSVSSDLLLAILSYPNATAFAKIRVLFDLAEGNPLDRETYPWAGELEDAHKPAAPAEEVPPFQAPPPKLVQ